MRQEKKGLLAGFRKLSCAVVVKMRNIMGSNRKEQNMTALIVQTHTHTQRHLVLLCREVRSHCSHRVFLGAGEESWSPQTQGQATFLTVNENYQSKEL